MAVALNLFVPQFLQKPTPAAIPRPMCPMDLVVIATVMITVVATGEA